MPPKTAAATKSSPAGGRKGDRDRKSKETREESSSPGPIVRSTLMHPPPAAPSGMSYRDAINRGSPVANEAVLAAPHKAAAPSKAPEPPVEAATPVEEPPLVEQQADPVPNPGDFNWAEDEYVEKEEPQSLEAEPEVPPAPQFAAHYPEEVQNQRDTNILFQAPSSPHQYVFNALENLRAERLKIEEEKQALERRKMEMEAELSRRRNEFNSQEERIRADMENIALERQSLLKLQQQLTQQQQQQQQLPPPQQPLMNNMPPHMNPNPQRYPTLFDQESWNPTFDPHLYQGYSIPRAQGMNNGGYRGRGNGQRGGYYTGPYNPRGTFAGPRPTRSYASPQ